MRPRRTALSLIATAATAAAAIPFLALAAPPYLLPDLVSSAPGAPTLQNYTYQAGCENGPGQSEVTSACKIYLTPGTSRLLLRFDGYIENRGDGPVDFFGNPSAGTMRQRAIGSSGGLEVLSDTRPSFKYSTTASGGSDGHDHWHLENAAQYGLFTSTTATAPARPALKVGFCFEDSREIEGLVPAPEFYTDAQVSGFCAQNVPGATSLNEGISKNWRDEYLKYLAYQWVDASDVTPGIYYVGGNVDPTNFIREKNETNNGWAINTTNAAVIPGYVAQASNPAAVAEGQPVTVPLTSTAYGTPGPVQYRIDSLPTKGTLRNGATTLAVGAIVGPGVTYVPNPGNGGLDSFQYSASDVSSIYPTDANYVPRAGAPRATATVTVGAAQASVGISNAQATLVAGGSMNLSATVTGVGGGVTWTVNGLAGGNASVGTITPAGVYTAPNVIPPAPVVIRATSQIRSSVFAEISVTIQKATATSTAPAPSSPPSQIGKFIKKPTFFIRKSGSSRIYVTTTKNTLAGKVSLAIFVKGKGKRVASCSSKQPAGQVVTCRLKVSNKYAGTPAKRKKLVVIASLKPKAGGPVLSIKSS
jgi:Lysyl oxidase